MRRPDTDPLRRVTFKKASFEPKLHDKMRRGRPRTHWTIQTLEHCRQRLISSGDTSLNRIPQGTDFATLPFDSPVFHDVMTAAAAHYVF